MLTALTSLALLGLVVLNGVSYASAMDDLFAHTATGLSRR